MKNIVTVDIKKQIIAEKDNHLKVLKANVQRLIVLLKKGISYEILSDVLSYFKMLSLNMDTELDTSNENAEAKFTLEFVQCLLTTIPKDDFENKHLKEKEFNGIIECASKIFSSRLRYLMAINFENSDNLSSEHANYIFIDFLRIGITGKRYDIFEIEHHRKILNPLSDYFKQCYGFDIEKVYDGLAKLKEEFTFGMSKTAEELNKFMDGKDINNLSEEEQMEGQSIFGKFFGLELHNVSSITTWPENFIKVFAYDLGENSSFVNNVNFENIINLHFDINKKPVINIEGNNYCPMIHRLLDNFDKILIKDICKRLASDAENVRSILANTSEIIVGEMFKNILPESTIYYNNYYKENSQFIENDILIEYDNSLIVIEVKSGSFTPDIAINNLNSHLSALNKLIEEADSQSNRLVNLLRINGHLDIYEDNKKRSLIKKTLKYSDYNYIFKFVITLDGFNEIEARAEKIGFLNLNDDVIVLSIDDLRVYSDYFENAPSLFFHYLIQRVLATRCKGINLNDELDHLGLYIAHNTYTYWADTMAKEYETDHILWTGYREDIDKYYNHRYLKISQDIFFSFLFES